MEQAALAQPRPPEARAYAFKFHGQYLDFLVLLLKNLFLTVATFGLYHAWARTARRQYLWQNTEVDGHRIEYTGRAEDLFRAYVKIAVVYFAFIGVSYLLQTQMPLAFAIFKLVFAIAMFFVFPWAVYRARNYILTNTRWRGIRMSMERDTTPYVTAHVKGWLLTLITLGLYNPWRMNQMQKVLTENTRIGNWNFGYDGKDEDVVRIYFKGLFLTLITLGVYYFWFKAELDRYYAEHTTIGGTRGRLNVKGGDYFELFLMNLLLVPITLGLAIPFVALMKIRLQIDRLSYFGHLDFDSLLQSQAQAAPAVSDGIAELFDVGAGV